MNNWLMMLLWLVSGGSAALVLLRAGSRSGTARAAQMLPAELPLPLRLLHVPAAALSTAIDPRLPASFRRIVLRRLEKADLHPGVEPAQWTSLCLCAAFTAALCAGAVALGLRLSPMLPVLATATLTWLGSERWLGQRIQRCERSIIRELPACLDLLTVCVEAGATLTAAARLIVEQSPEGPVRSYFERVLREVRSGRLRAQAFVRVAEAYGVECLCTLAAALAHAEASGMSIGQVLRSQAEQRSSERFMRAERQAMQAPVKMLAPLILCIFPCTFIVLAVPIAHHLMEALGR